MTVRANLMIELIAASASPFCRCSCYVLKWFLTPTESKNSIISFDLFSPSLSLIATTRLCFGVNQQCHLTTVWPLVASHPLFSYHTAICIQYDNWQLPQHGNILRLMQLKMKMNQCWLVSVDSQLWSFLQENLQEYFFLSCKTHFVCFSYEVCRSSSRPVTCLIVSWISLFKVWPKRLCHFL